MKNIIFSFAVFFFFLINAYAQTSFSSNFPSKTTYPSGIAEGPSVYGVFEGRTPCQEISKELNITVREECDKRKWGLTLFQDPVSLQPTTFKINGLGSNIHGGRWHIVKGRPTSPQAIIYQLDVADADTSVFLLKGDDNVLFVLDNKRNFLVGNARFSYTLNRVRN